MFDLVVAKIGNSTLIFADKIILHGKYQELKQIYIFWQSRIFLSEL